MTQSLRREISLNDIIMTNRRFINMVNYRMEIEGEMKHVDGPGISDIFSIDLKLVKFIAASITEAGSPRSSS